MEEEKPDFELITLCPPLVYGEVAQYVPSTEALNTSSERLYEILTGKAKEIPVQGVMIFVNAQDLGNAHALAIVSLFFGIHPQLTISIRSRVLLTPVINVSLSQPMLPSPTRLYPTFSSNITPNPHP
jgi:hypothetical protein